MKFAPTPVGPDWAIAFNEGIVKHIYFVAETKACTGVGGCLHRRWRMPARALAHEHRFVGGGRSPSRPSPLGLPYL
jgi:hypothetical protein